MALNFLGLGFSFGGRDDGFNEEAENAANGMGLIERAVRGVNDIATTNKLSLIGDAFRSFQLGDINSKLDDMNSELSDVGSAGQNSLDDISDAVAKVKANFGGTGVAAEAAGKLITSNIGTAGATVEQVSEIADAFLKRFDPSEIGPKRFQKFTKLLKLGEIDANAFAGGLSNAEKSFGLTSTASDRLIDRVAATGATVGQTGEALSGMAAVITQVSDKSAEFGKALTAEQFEEIVVGTTGLAAAFKKIGGTMEEGQEKALRILDTFFDLSLNIDDMKAGLGGALDGFVDLGKGGIGLSKTLELLEKDPLAGAAALGKLRTELDKGGGNVERFDKVIAKQLGPDFRFLLEKLGPDAERVLGKELPVSLEKAEKATERYTAALGKSGKIAQEVLDRQKESFERRLGTIARKTVPGLRKSIGENFKKAGDTLDRFSKDKGPLGKVTRGLVSIQQFGLTPVLGQFGAFAEILGPVVTAAAPVVTAMTGLLPILGSIVGVLFGPIGLIAGLGLLVFAFTDTGKEATKGFLDTIKKVLPKGMPEAIENVWIAAKAELSSVTSEQVTEFLKQGFEIAKDKITEAIESPMGQAVIKAVKTIAIGAAVFFKDQFIEAVKTAFSKDSTLGETLVASAIPLTVAFLFRRQLFFIFRKVAFPVMKFFGRQLWKGLMGHVFPFFKLFFRMRIVPLAVKAFKFIARQGVMKMAVIGAAIGIAFAIGKNAVRAFSDDSLNMWQKFEETGEGALTDIIQFFGQFFGTSKAEVREFVDVFGLQIGRGIFLAIRFFERFGESIGRVLSDAFDDLKIFGDKFVNFFGVIKDTAVEIFKGISLQDLLTGKIALGGKAADIFKKNLLKNFAKENKQEKALKEFRLKRDEADEKRITLENKQEEDTFRREELSIRKNAQKTKQKTDSGVIPAQPGKIPVAGPSVVAGVPAGFNREQKKVITEQTVATVGLKDAILELIKVTKGQKPTTAPQAGSKVKVVVEAKPGTKADLKARRSGLGASL